MQTSELCPGLVSVLIPTFNRAGLVEQSIDSILAQTYPQVELIVIDDGSTDATETVLRGYGDRLACGKIENSGKAAALNEGLKMAHGEFIFVLDDDDLALPPAMELLVGALHENPDAGLSYSSYYRERIDADGHAHGRELFSVPKVDADSVFPTLLTGMFFTQQGSLVRTRCYLEVGGFNEDMKRVQDYEMLLRLTRRYPAVHVPEPTVVVRSHPGERGPMSDRFPARERMMRGWSYSTICYRELYGILSLREYLPRSAAAGDLSPALQREAMFRRMSIMMRKGVWDAALADLRDIIENRMDAGPLSAEERKACEAALRHPPIMLTLSKEKEIGKQIFDLLSDRRARGIASHFMRGAYWAGHELVRDGEMFAATTHYTATLKLWGELILTG